MSSESDEDPIRRSSTEHYDIVGVDLDWFLILGSASSIFFGFLLKIALNSQSYKGMQRRICDNNHHAAT
ncbi:MAG: hypothetical protein WBZ36_01305 [Candidatus Nitrosopolaris sp.]